MLKFANLSTDGFKCIHHSKAFQQLSSIKKVLFILLIKRSHENGECRPYKLLCNIRDSKTRLPFRSKIGRFQIFQSLNHYR